MKDDTAKADPYATQEMPARLPPESIDHVTSPYQRSSGSGSGSGRLQVRCPNCRMPVEVAADTSFTDLTCAVCGSHFSLVDQTQASWQAPSLSTLGRFELIERLGVGAYGTVWKARDRQLDRIVAVKVPRQGGMDVAETEAFFKEARAAAQLRHPNIVSVHEVGRDGDSVYIVSDFVRGVTLGDWLTGQQLTGREAAELCAKVAEALHHAHEQGVVHRDLKPANIMIDADGQPHLMDFGLARREVGEVRMTLDGQVLGTPAYMSPEQAQGESHAADRRSDVYSLGVILFQMLTGELPFRGNARMVMHQVIHDEPPSPRKFNANISKDIETITLKCLQKEPGRRYATAAFLADDLKRYLAGDAIAARPIGALQRGWRWCKKKPAIASLTVAAAGLLIAVAAVASVGYVMTSRALSEKEQSAATAEQVSKFLTDLFRSSDPIGWASGENFEFVRGDATAANLTARELVDRGAERITTQLADQPAVQATLLETIGGVYREMGLFGDAVRLLEAALQKRQSMVPPEQLKIAAVKHNLGNTLHLIGRYDEAERYLRDALETRRELLGNEHLDTSATMQTLGLVLGTTRRFDEAEQLLDAAIEIRRHLKGDNYQGVAIALAAKGAVLLAKGDAEAANPSIAEALLVFSKMKGGNFAAEAIAKYQQGMLAIEDERFADAARLMKETLDSATTVLGSAHPYVAFIASDYALAQAGLGDMEGACKTSELAMEICRKSIPSDHPMVLLLGRRLVSIYVERGRFDEALVMSDRTCADAKNRFGPQSAEYAKALLERAYLMRKWGKLDAALATAREGYAIISKQPEVEAVDVWLQRAELAECLLANHKPAEAVTLLKGAISIHDGQYSPPGLSDSNRLAVLELLGNALLASGAHDEAGRTFQQGKRIAERNDVDQPAWAAWFQTLMARVLIAQGRLPEAEPLLKTSGEALEKTKGPDHRWTREAADALEKLRLRRAQKVPTAQTSS